MTIDPEIIEQLNKPEDKYPEALIELEERSRTLVKSVVAERNGSE